MALKQVGARTEGDVFQGLFFWKQAAELLRPKSMVERVVLEHDDADGVDDVVVFYSDPGVNAGGWMANADYFQLKYHVDNREAYCSSALIDPSFINAKYSLLQRFYNAYTKLKTGTGDFRLFLASNWRWQVNDKLAPLLREYDGKLPRKFFEDSPRGKLGKIREQWRIHLGIDHNEFDSFARRLRLQLDLFGRRDFTNYVYVTLEAAGLRIPSADRAACPYESLIQQFLMNGPNSFDAKTLRELCKQEGLLVETKESTHRPFSLGVRSFVRSAERIESEVDEFVCVTSQFNGRHPSSNTSWETSLQQVLAFLGNTDRQAQLRTVDSEIALECHGSLALLAGWELSRNSGVRVAPIQKPSLKSWRPSENSSINSRWIEKTVGTEYEVDDIAVCLSVTHEIYADVEAYLSYDDAPRISRIVILTPECGPSPMCISGPDQAYQLAVQLPGILAKARSNRRSRVHLFFACPNAMMFFIGQQREALGRFSLYEYDFGIERDIPYQHSFSFPIAAHFINETKDNPDESSI